MAITPLFKLVHSAVVLPSHLTLLRNLHTIPIWGPSTHPDEVAQAINLQSDVEPASHSGDEEIDDDITSDSHEPTADDLEELLLDSVNHAQKILRQPQTAETLASRVLDDAYHFMDRLLRLLSKKHPTYKEFAHLFSESIFIHDGGDEAKVREILKQKGIGWEYAIRAKKAALHRRIRRYIPSPEKLVQDLSVLFSCFQDICDADSKKIFSKETRKQAISGSLHASSALTEAILGNWFHCWNRRIGHYNRTGTKWNNHFDIWLLDEIVETAIQLDVKPTFPEPKLLATRIATSETFGIIPLTPQLASANEITILPSPNILAATHHDDNHCFALTQFSTKPVNLYRYLQLRQRTTTAVVPVHTRREFELFQANIVSFIPLNINTAPEMVYKVTKYEEFARFWNCQVATQLPAELDSSKRIYFKLPEQLERHHKKSIQWKTTRATLNMDENVTALEPIHQLVRDSSHKAIVLPAITHEPVEVDYITDPLVGVDLSSFNPMAMRQHLNAQHAIRAAIAAVPSLEPPPVQLEVHPLPRTELQQTVLVFASAEQGSDYKSQEISRPTKKDPRPNSGFLPA
ncbi:hypothetical protein DFH07DRAFT_960610 [Mycena maculata]|uniref:Uncharacterized protein n=1 Tax=Mycena maculata TaxID=230809 RepID=A0AAD7NA37_9AGAR|nr:hypothetical protein DFH07DRAFT_960610 [Mycena maculata]